MNFTNQLSKARSKLVGSFYDFKFGVKTQSKLYSLNSKKFPYVATDWNKFKNSLQQIGAEIPGKTFIDIGCGRGRAILVASQFPFQKLIGVDYSQYLIDSAMENWQIFLQRTNTLKTVGLQNAYIQDFEFPADDLFIFNYHSLNWQDLKDVLNRLRELKKNGKKIVFLYQLPIFHSEIMALGYIKLHSLQPQNKVYCFYEFV